MEQQNKLVSFFHGSFFSDESNLTSRNYDKLEQNLARNKDSRGRIFSFVRPFYE